METTFGPAYEERVDGKRVNKQMSEIKSFMLRMSRLGMWLTLGEIETNLEFPQTSISAQLRHLRKTRFGGYVVDKRRRGDAWEYRVTAPENGVVQTSLQFS